METTIFTLTLLFLACCIVYVNIKWRAGIRLGSRILAIIAMGVICITIIYINRPQPVREDLLPPPAINLYHEVPTPEPNVGEVINTADFDPNSI